MNYSKATRQRLKAAKRIRRTGSDRFAEIDLTTNKHPAWMTRAYSNNRFIVMLDDNAKTSHGPAIKAMIQSNDDRPIHNHWSVIQAIKNEIFGEETVAVEYYPRESRKMDDFNIYWIWIFPEGVLPEPV